MKIYHLDWSSKHQPRGHHVFGINFSSAWLSRNPINNFRRRIQFKGNFLHEGYPKIYINSSTNFDNSKVFDQSTINAEKMFYIQAGVNQSSDYFTFDVTNGIEWLRGLMLKILIIPENLYIKTKVLNVEEGKSNKLSPDHMVPYSEFYNGKIIDYKILEHPRFGNIRSGKSSKINRFTQKQLEAGAVFYLHNGSEDLQDTILLVAFGKNKESLPFNLNINVLPVNDEIPHVVTNTGLQMWIGGKAVLKNTDLSK
jgi:chondroitin sulfate proteoglycan 4